MAAVGAEHLQPRTSLLRGKNVGDLGQQVLEVQPVLLLDLQHPDEHAGHLLSKLLLDALQLLQQRVQPDLEVLVVVDVRQALPEDDLHQHESECEYVGLGGVVLGIGPVLREGDHLLRREIDALDVALLVYLLVSPSGLAFAHHAPAIPVGNALLADADGLAVERHLADALDDLEEFLEGGGADVLEEHEVGHEEVVGEDEIVDGHGVRSVAVLAFADVELHALVADALEVAVDGAALAAEALALLEVLLDILDLDHPRTVQSHLNNIITNI